MGELKTVEDYESEKFFVSDDGIPMTTSIALAKIIGKKHYHVMRDIEALIPFVHKKDASKFGGMSIV